MRSLFALCLLLVSSSLLACDGEQFAQTIPAEVLQRQVIEEKATVLCRYNQFDEASPELLPAKIIPEDYIDQESLVHARFGESDANLFSFSDANRQAMEQFALLQEVLAEQTSCSIKAIVIREDVALVELERTRPSLPSDVVGEVMKKLPGIATREERQEFLHKTFSAYEVETSHHRLRFLNTRVGWRANFIKP